MQEKRQLRAESGGEAEEGAPNTVSSKRAELEARQRQKLVEKKKEDARRRRSGEEVWGS